MKLSELIGLGYVSIDIGLKKFEYLAKGFHGGGVKTGCTS